MSNRTLAACLAILAGGCSREKQPASGGASNEPVAARRAVLGGASVIGHVTLVGKAPQNPVIDMTEEPQCKARYPNTPRQQIVEVNGHRALANVFVYVKSGVPADAQYAPPATPVVINQQGCRYHPRVFGIMVGQPLEITNSDPLLHNIKAMGKLNRPFNISQPAAGMTTERSFSASEVMLPLECNVHGWMHAYVGVLSHPFFATTGSDGRFAIDHLPPGRYEIAVWHEKYGTQTASVTVQDSVTKTVDFTYTAK